MDIIFDDTEFQTAINKLIKNQLPEALKQGITKACLLVEADAKRECPVDDGILKASITHEIITDGETQGIIGTNVESAPYVHEGTGIYAIGGMGRQTQWKYKTADGKWYTTKGNKSNQFLKKAVEKNRNNILKCFEGELK